MAELLGEAQHEEVAAEKAERAMEAKTGQASEAKVAEAQAIWERQQWQRRFLAAEAAIRPFKRIGLPSAADFTTTQKESQHDSSDDSPPCLSADLQQDSTS